MAKYKEENVYSGDNEVSKDNETIDTPVLQEELKSAEIEGESEEAPMSEEEMQKILANVSKESNLRQFYGVPKQVTRWICVAFTVFMLIINNAFNFFPFNQIPFLDFLGNLPPQIHRSSFVALIILYTFLLYPARKKHRSRVNYVPWYDVVLGIVGAGAFFYHTFNFRTIAGQMMIFTTVDFVMAVIGIVVLFFACYRVVGLPLMVVVGSFIAYAYFGHLIPGVFGHAGYRADRIFTYLFYTTEGVIGTPIGVASTFIFLFLLFSAFLIRTGISALFIDFANVIAGRATGGPAKVSVVVSALEGMVSGSSIANTVASGSFTIPLMKRLGYEKNFAGAVEAAASTGGQILPPILGAAAFLMAEITGIPFTQIALGALIPAILYFTCVFASVHFEAKKVGLRPVPEDEIPTMSSVAKRLQLLLPLVALIYFLSTGTTLAFAALYAAAVAIAVSSLPFIQFLFFFGLIYIVPMFVPENIGNPLSYIALYTTIVIIVIRSIRGKTLLTPSKFFEALEVATKNSIGVAVACAMAGMIVGVVTLTGLGMTFATSMLSLADNIGHEILRMVIILIFCMLASLILGLGVPTTAKYLIMATITAPILVSIGIPVLAAHMFVFFFATDADITPPAGLAGYAASAISGGTPLKTCVIAMRLAMAAYIVPYIFVFSPQMLFIDWTPGDIVHIMITALIGITGVAAGLSGFLVRRINWVERILLIGGGILLINPIIVTNLIGAGIIFGLFFLQKVQVRRKAAVEVGQMLEKINESKGWKE
jgi:TRAP transporter 4TM/12TM fusion protein